MERVLPIADPDTQAEDLTVLRAFLARLGANDPVLDTVAALVARLLREQARLNGKLAALLRGKAVARAQHPPRSGDNRPVATDDTGAFLRVPLFRATRGKGGPTPRRGRRDAPLRPQRRAPGQA